MAPVPDILSDNFFEVIIVGGGTCGLAVAARLCENTPAAVFTDDEHQRFHWLRQRNGRQMKNGKRQYESASQLKPHEILVLDAVADRFMGQWDAQFGACQIPHLRSPMFFHPDPGNIDAMVAWAHQTGRESELKEIPNVVGRELSKHQQKRMRRKSSSASRNASSHDRPGIVDVNMREWRDYYRPSTPFFCDFCQSLVQRYNLGDCVRKDEVVSICYGDVHIFDKGMHETGFIVTTSSGKIYAAKVCVVASGHRGRINFPLPVLRPVLDQVDEEMQSFLDHTCHTTHIFSGAVRFPPAAVEKRISQRTPAHLVIVGGGLTSAQLAHVACMRGIPTTLLLRGPEKIKHFDFHLDWVTKYKNVKKASFYQLDSDYERLQLMADAREGGSVNPEYHMLLKKHCAAGRLSMLKYTTIDAAEMVDGRWKLRLKAAKPSTSDEVKPCTSDTSILSSDMNSVTSDMNSVTSEMTEKIAALNIEYVSSDISSTQSSDNVSLDEMGAEDDDTESWLSADYVCCATGVSPDIEGLEFMRPILNEFPIDVVGGFPCLTEHLQWNEDLPLYMVGKNASLRIGPTSANLDGARLGAERVGWKIQNDRRGASNSLDTRLEMAANNMNWYNILQEA
ncbi:hypothetical protein CLUG_05048 [Clavispora lusitaniae ATCC 42720]|uniref:FAD/NAD(P)-binding domain-containing protein n=1 Tax=Clavispora lusitaniae (strain ATCC 42720) TaxID=306902 RepID=C4YAB0_CLAL4|nr:uncharacterized protein CLUG_05048 [Clavispora lusitaniae ATCC 42720]EEQ40921.1 hypothetical protein CLUG_05048 [Clavispora lusitaniae ATCC 42720]